MTIGEAVDVLNRERHNGAASWRASRYHGLQEARDRPAFFGGCLVMSDDPASKILSEFEAIAIAEAYERKAHEQADAVLSRPLD